MSQEIEGIDYVICKWDGRKIKGSLGKYINHKWGKGTWEKYKEEFPDTPKMCQNYALATSKNSGKHMKLPKYRLMASEKMKGENNINHKSKTTLEERKRRSPFSAYFVSYSSNKDDARMEVSKFAKDAVKNRLTESQYEYWVKKTNGDEELAKKLYKDRQNTFSLEKLQNKYGQEEGYTKWKSRQDKWKKKVFCDNI